MKDWREDPLWANLCNIEKLAAMSLLEVGVKNVKQAKNVAHAIYNRASKLDQDISYHINYRAPGVRYGWYQPLYEEAQHKRLLGVLQSEEFMEMLDYCASIDLDEVPDPTKGATHYLIPAKKMHELSGGVTWVKGKGWRGNSEKYYSWPSWSGFDPETMSYKGETLNDGIHSFLILKE